MADKVKNKIEELEDTKDVSADLHANSAEVGAKCESDEKLDKNEGKDAQGSELKTDEAPNSIESKHLCLELDATDFSAESLKIKSVRVKQGEGDAEGKPDNNERKEAQESELNMEDAADLPAQLIKVKNVQVKQGAGDAEGISDNNKRKEAQGSELNMEDASDLSAQSIKVKNVVVKQGVGDAKVAGKRELISLPHILTNLAKKSKPRQPKHEK